jgi:hypothetical protein
MKNNIILTMIALLSSVFAYSCIYYFIFPISILQYILVEGMITVLHLLYNQTKYKMIIDSIK